MRAKRHALIMWCCIACTGQLWCGVTGVAVSAQEVEDTVRVKTRAVFIEAIVRDKRTGAHVTNLAAENFEVLDDGKPRPIRYFSREGERRKRPLALVLIVDLNRMGSGRYLRRPDILEPLAAALKNLSPEDEVGVVANHVLGAYERCEWLLGLTRDHKQVAAALAVVPALVAPGAGNNLEEDGEAWKETGAHIDEAKQKQEKQNSPPQHPEQENGAANDNDNDDDDDNDGDDAGIDVPNKELDDIGQEVTRLASVDRRDSQVVVVHVTDGIMPIDFEDRDEWAAKLLESNVTYNALVCNLRKVFSMVLLPVFKPIGNKVGLSLYGTAQYFAEQTGGEAVRVRRPEDYGQGLGQIIGNLAARYSLGFALAEADEDDGRMHRLEVRVKVRDERGKERKLIIGARRGYQAPKEAASEPRATPH